jgi:predicted site-specific integrase-resolvase
VILLSTSDPKTLSAADAAKYVGRTVKTLQRLDREGTLVPASRSSTNRRLYSQAQLDEFLGFKREKRVPTRIIAYCRVSSAAQRPDLKNQRSTLETFAAARGFADIEFIEEIGGGLNFERKKFLSLIDAIVDGEVRVLILAHKDRLARFGFPLLQHLCKRNGCDLLVLNNETLSPEQEMVQDLMTITHCFSARLYGLRNYRKKLDEALKSEASQ